MIGIGCLIYINQPNPVGAFFFSIGLLGVFYFGLNLFTGKIGYVRTKKDIICAILIFAANILGAALFFIIPQTIVHCHGRQTHPYRNFLRCRVWTSVQSRSWSFPHKRTTAWQGSSLCRR